MTIIAAQKTTTGVLMGADNNISDGSRLIRRASPKLVNLSSRLALASSGLVWAGDALRSAGAVPYPSGSVNPDEYEQDLGRFFRAFLKANDVPRDAPFWALIAADRDIYYVGPNGSATRVNAPYAALGNAEFVALGALFALNSFIPVVTPNRDMAQARLTVALDACVEHVECIRPPWSFAETIAPT